MFSNDCYSYDSCGSDSSDCVSNHFLDRNHSDQALITTSRLSAHLDHSYGPTATNCPKISTLSQFDPFISDQMEDITAPLFEDMSAYALDDSDDFANAPTPFMASGFADLNDIESDDLLDFDSNQIKPIVDNNNNDSIEMPFVENEVEIGVIPIETNAINDFIGDDSQLYHNTDIEHRFDKKDWTQPLLTNDINPRKRSNCYSNEDYESEDEDEEDSYESEHQSKRRSKVGRKPSKSQNKCMSRNAIAARENRERKKAYVDNMEKRLRLSEDNNKQMKTIINTLKKSNEELNYEVKYLRGVLANDSTISDLIKHMSNSNQIELIGTQFVATTDPIVDSKGLRKSTRIASKGETLPQTTVTKLKQSVESSGVCLHIHNKRVSLELCAKCSQKHKKSK